jgi:hypothetical protein
MLGEGIVSLGVEPSTVCLRNSKASPKIVSLTPSLPSTLSAAGVKSIPPSSFSKCTTRSSSALEMPSSE